MKILGVRVDEYDMEQALARLAEVLAAPMGRSPAHVVTINPEGVMLAREDKELLAIIDQAQLVTADGNGILWAASRSGRPLPERVTGIDLIEGLAALGAKRGWSIYFLGAQPGRSELAAAELAARYPGLTVAGCDNGYFRDREAEAIARVRESRADILLAALGMPFQEKWLYQHRLELGCKLAIGVGGSFDVLSGAVKRAPLWLQRLKLEWLWRLLADPRRWRRYLAIPRFMAAVKREARTSGKGV